MKGWLRDVEMEQCENRSHKGATSLAHGGILGVHGVCLLEEQGGGGGTHERQLKMRKWRHVGGGHT